MRNYALSQHLGWNWHFGSRDRFRSSGSKQLPSRREGWCARCTHPKAAATYAAPAVPTSSQSRWRASWISSSTTCTRSYGEMSTEVETRIMPRAEILGETCHCTHLKVLLTRCIILAQDLPRCFRKSLLWRTESAFWRARESLLDDNPAEFQ